MDAHQSRFANYQGDSMTENITPDMIDNEGIDDGVGVSMQAHLRPMDGEEMVLRQIVLGMNPLILIEVDMDASSETMMAIKLDTTGFNPDELLDFLGTMIEVIEAAKDSDQFIEH
jgi:hypothetical protein